MRRSSLSRRDTAGRWLVLLGIAYPVLHHGGTIFAGLGDVGSTETRWADWIDLLTPFAVTGAVAGAMRATGATRPAWTGFWFGAVLYTLGHGIHLAANSVGNAAPGEPAHLWDERVGHYLWYAGFAVLVAALAATVHDRPMRGGLLSYALALLVGFTHFTNSVEGQTPVMGIAVAAGFAVWGFTSRHDLGRLLLVAYGFALVLLIGFGVWQHGFPEFSELGWI